MWIFGILLNSSRQFSRLQTSRTMNDMTYYDSAEGTTITKVRALLELHNHGITDPDEFFEECGEHPQYNAQEVLEWLGY